MQHSALGVVLIPPLEVVFRVDGHIRCRHGDVPVVRDVHACRVVHFIIGTRSDGEAADGALAVIKHRIDIGREHALVRIVHLNRGIGPPEERLGQAGAVAYTTLYLKIRAAGAQRETCCTLLVEHPLHLVHPHCHTAVLVLDDVTIDWQEGRGSVVLRPVELNAAADPRSRQPNECRLNHMVIIHEMTLFDFVVGHLDAPAQLRQYHHLDIFIFQPHGLPFLVNLLVAD